MSNAIITVENLSKSYFINHEGQRESYTALRDVVANKAKKIFSFPKAMKANTSSFSKKEEFFALKDVSFEINQGDRVGIIGRNGAGKSTLLKIISRITEPTSGNIRIKGRVASLLEVGTGFHPELTGRENIYLNGAILGMSRAEIRQKFDEIVAFSEVEKFLDTPVKRYSSGMYVRLAFAVAAHLEPEVLIVDEVLAVGDAQFQKKCLGKMEDVSTNEGRTVLFVSHNMNAINTLCSKGIYLLSGSINRQGKISDVLKEYLAGTSDIENIGNSFERDKNPIGKNSFFKKVTYVDDTTLSHFQLKLTIEILSFVTKSAGINIRLKDDSGHPIGYGAWPHVNGDSIKIKEGLNRFQIKTSFLDLATGKYKLSFELVVPGSEYLDKLEDCLFFELSNDLMPERHFSVNQNWGYGSLHLNIQNFENVN